MGVAGSITFTTPPSSEETQTWEPSCFQTAMRGRGATSTFATTLPVAALMKCAMLVVSEVFTMVPPSGLTPMPSGSTPVGISVSALRAATSMTVTMLSFSLET